MFKQRRPRASVTLQRYMIVSPYSVPYFQLDHVTSVNQAEEPHIEEVALYIYLEINVVNHRLIVTVVRKFSENQATTN